MAIFDKDMKYVIDGQEVAFKCKANPSLADRLRIANDASYAIVNDIIGYEPTLYEYAICVAMITNLTDIKLPESFEESAEFIAKTDFYTLLHDIYFTFLVGVTSDVSAKVEFEKERITHRSGADELFHNLAIIVEKYGDNIESLQDSEVVAKLAKIADAVNIPEKDLVSNILDYEKKQDTDSE